MDPNTRALMMGAAGAGGAAAKTYVEDVFGTFLYTGNGSTQTITNGIDLSGKGGLVWIKGRSVAYNNVLNDTGRGVTQQLSSNQTDGQQVYTTGLTAFTSTGFSIGNNIQYNESSQTYASWTFRKAAKFFDVVTYTGTGAASSVNHSLGSTPGVIIIKRTDSAADWIVYHRSTGTGQFLYLNDTSAAISSSKVTAASASTFSLVADSNVNANGGSFVAYLFAHDAGGFGDSGNESVVTCGSFTEPASGDTDINLGWEPQLVILKASSSSSNWILIDNMRGFAHTLTNNLYPNQNIAEITTSGTTYVKPTSTGFRYSAGFIGSGVTLVYIAIRRGPMKAPTDATTVFDVDLQNGGSFVTNNFPVDLTINARPSATTNKYASARLTGGTELLAPNLTDAATTGTYVYFAFDKNNGIEDDNWGSGSSSVYWNFRRAPGFFDVVAYAGTGSARTVSHNLGVAPELMIVKARNGVGNEWVVYASPLGASQYVVLNQNTAKSSFDSGADNTRFWNSTAPTASVFTITGNGYVNGSTGTYIAYLFASCPGISKVGSYTGTGTTLSIDCGFTAGARFVMIKRTDSTGDWYIWDTARGIVSGNDSYLLLNSTAAEVTNTDYIDPLSSGFQISSTAPAAINANGGSFIYLAVA
jgi:hypothetical protein